MAGGFHHLGVVLAHCCSMVCARFPGHFVQRCPTTTWDRMVDEESQVGQTCSLAGLFALKEGQFRFDVWLVKDTQVWFWTWTFDAS